MSAGNSIGWFVAGALAGAAAALLLAPDSGENTRAKIKKGAADVASKAKSTLAERLDAIESALAQTEL